MGAGRPAKPLEQKKLQGTDRKDRIPMNPIKPMMLSKVPKCPLVSKVAKEEWKWVCEVLLSEGRLHVPDLIWIRAMAFERDVMEYAQSKMYTKNSEEYLKELVIEQVNQGGQEYQTVNAWRKIYSMAWEKYSKAAIELGLSARIRGSINGGAGTASNPLRNLMQNN